MQKFSCSLQLLAGGRIRKKKPKHPEQERSDMLWLLLLYSTIRYRELQQKGCRKAHVHPWHVEERREIMRFFFWTIRLGGLHSWIVLQDRRDKCPHTSCKDVAMLKQTLLVQCRLVSASLFFSSMLSTMLGVVSTDIFPWSPVSIYKSQLCCQNIRAASAASSCKVSSCAIASSWALQYPMILSCLWPFPSTQSFL